jgi:preprotein translocase subunit SecG
MLSGLLTFLLIAVALILILLIIALQHGNEGGIGSAFGSGNSAGFFGASGGVSLITRATWGFGFAFFAISMSLAWVKTHDHFGVGREIEGLLGEESSVAPVASPAAAAPAVASPAAASGTSNESAVPVASPR